MTITTDNLITPAAAQQAFALTQDLVIVALVRMFPEFDIHALDREAFWSIADCGVQIAKLKAPVRIDDVLRITDEFVEKIFNAVCNQKEKSTNESLH